MRHAERYRVLLRFDMRTSIMPDVVRIRRTFTTAPSAERFVRRVLDHGLWQGTRRRRLIYPAHRLVSAQIDPASARTR